MVDMTDGRPRPRGAAGDQERPVLPTGALRRGSRLAVLPLRHAAHTAAAATRLSRAATDQVAARTAEQVFATLGELKGGAAKLGQAMSVFEAAMPEEVAAPYRSALRRLADAQPAMPAGTARRVVDADLTVTHGPHWRERLRLARQVGALAQDAQLDPELIVDLLHPIAATAATDSFTYSRPWLRGLMAHLTDPRFATALRNLTPPPEYALVWRATLSAAGLFAQLGATVPTRGLHLAYSPGFRGSLPGPGHG